MPKATYPYKVAQSFHDVNSYQLSLFSDSPDSMIHHKVGTLKRIIIERRETYGVSSSYRVSRSHRVLSPGMLIKRFDDVRRFLRDQLALAPAQREVTLRLLRFWAYYGLVVPKASTVTELPGCSKATYWRTVRLLKDQELVQVVNRYVIRPHAQISNLYRFDRLMVLLARYLAERGTAFYEKWLKPYLRVPGALFWTSTRTLSQSSLSGSTLDGT